MPPSTSPPRADLRQRLGAAIAGARSEVRLWVPATPAGHRLARQVGEPLRAAAARPVRVRVLVEAAALLNEPAGLVFARDVATAGGTVRASRRLPGFTVQVDLSSAFAPAADCGGPGVVVVRDRDALVALAAMFEHEWRLGLIRDLVGGGPELPDETDLAVLSALATGAKDEVVGRRLGLSVRSVRRRIAQVQERLGATSRFETGVRAAELGWVTVAGRGGS